MSTTNLPAKPINDSAAGTRLFYESLSEQAYRFSSNEVDVTVGFLTSRGFSKEAAEVCSLSFLKQARIDNVPVYSILESMKGLDKVQISQVVARILNNNRVPISLVGYRQPVSVPINIGRNILP